MVERKFGRQSSRDTTRLKTKKSSQVSVDNFHGVVRVPVDNYLTLCEVSPLPCCTWSLWLRSVVGAAAVAAVVGEPEVGTVVWCATL